jgi:hypothetical protein
MNHFLFPISGKKAAYVRMSGSASPARKLFHLLPNGAFHQRPNPVRYRSSGSLFQLLSDASSILKLHGPAKQAYTQDGKPVKSL